MDYANIREHVKEEFTIYLNKHKHRKTPERYAILDHIYSSKGHFDMDSLYNTMQNSNFRVSRATLYNTIELLLDCGLVVKHQFGANVSQYERAYGNENHDHLICINCGSVREYKNGNLFVPAKQKTLERFKVSYYSMYIYGICSKCQRHKIAEERKLEKAGDKKETTKKTSKKK
ncbi:MAG: transcriptional repressor [Bacteroidales bacterium 45-6]|nr:MAG: transcriptional repressor [Bacteroidales bacterium 45-6]